MKISLLSNESEQSDGKIDGNENRKYRKYWKCVNNNSFDWSQLKRTFIIEIFGFSGNYAYSSSTWRNYWKF